MVIYLDVLFCLNAIGSLFQLLTAQMLCKRSVATWRTAAVCVLGGVGASAAFFAPQSTLLSLMIQACGAMLLCAAAFAPCPPRVWLRTTAVFAAAGMLFTGAASAVWYLLEPDALTVHNGAVYFEISPLLLIGSTTLCYLALSLISRLCARQPTQQLLRLSISRGSRTATVRAIVDTGCALTEPISGADVLVIDANAAAALLSAEELTFFTHPTEFPQAAPADARIIPASTVSGSTVLAAFRPDQVCLLCDSPPKLPQKLYVAVCPHRLSDDYDALIGSCAAIGT